MAELTHSSTHPPLPPTTEDDRLNWLRLLRSRRVGIATFWRLLSEYGTARAALDALPGIARAAGVADYEICPEGVVLAEVKAARAAGARSLCAGDRAYPKALHDIPDAPPFLWTRGDTGLLARPMVALVGARSASSLGERMARALAADLAEAGIVVVSGLARGIDAAAHQAALGGGTIAVMAGGVDVIYPTENARLAADILQMGLILSDQPMGLNPQARHFPARNRIISGLSQAVVVVEAAAKSGSLITARNALDQGREVFAVPGHPMDARAAGCNMLIRDGATLIRSAADVIEALGHDIHPVPIVADSADVPAARLFVGPVAGPPGQRPVAAAAVRAGVVPAAGIAADTEPATRPAAPSGQRPIVTPATMTRPGPAETIPGAAREDTAGPARPRGTPAPPDLPMAAAGDPARLRKTAALHRQILDRLGPSPLAEDQLIRDLATPAQEVAPALLDLEMEGQVLRQPGGLLSRIH